MMNVKREIQMSKLALAALLLGVFTLNPIARAADGDERIPAAAPTDIDIPDAKSDGLKFSELRSLTNNLKFEIKDDQLLLTGTMPRKCLEGRVITAIESDAAKKEHSLKIDLPGCKGKTLSELEKRQLVSVALALKPQNFDASVDGKFCLKNSTDGDGIFTCDPIKAADGKQLEHKSLATATSERVKIEQDAAAKQRRSDREKREKQLVEKVGLLCRQGDFAGVGLEIEAAREFLGDLTQILDQIGKAKMKKAEDALKKAKTPEELKEAYELLLAEGYDADDALKIYVDRRLQMGKDLVAGRTGSVSSIESGIRDLESDLRDAGVFEENKAAISWLFVELGNRLRDDKDYDGAESLYNKALLSADNKGRVKIEQEMAKMFLAAAEACQDENKTKLAKCDALAKKAEKHMAGAIAQQGRMKGDDALEELNAMKAEKIQQFGISVVKVKVSGYGEYNPYGGAFAQRKQQMYQTGMQEIYMQRMMQQQMGGQGTIGAGGSGSFFR